MPQKEEVFIFSFQVLSHQNETTGGTDLVAVRRVDVQNFDINQT